MEILVDVGKYSFKVDTENEGLLNFAIRELQNEIEEEQATLRAIDNGTILSLREAKRSLSIKRIACLKEKISDLSEYLSPSKE